MHFGKKKKKEIQELHESKLILGGSPYLMVGPAMILLMIFVFYPLVNLVYLSFFDYNLISEPKFIGLKNY